MINKSLPPLDNVEMTLLNTWEEAPETIDACFISIIDTPGQDRAFFGPVKVWYDFDTTDNPIAHIAAQGIRTIPHMYSIMESNLDAIAGGRVSGTGVEDTLAAMDVMYKGISWDSLVLASRKSDIISQTLHDMVFGILEQTSSSVFEYYPFDGKSTSVLTTLMAFDDRELENIKDDVISYLTAYNTISQPLFRLNSSNTKFKKAQRDFTHAQKQLFSYIESNDKVEEFLEVFAQSNSYNHQQ